MNDLKRDEYLLSICIPTYNRPDQFQKMLIGLLPQLTSEIELVIRDDSPNEETKEVFDRLIAEFRPAAGIRYFQGEKIGLDAANLFLLEKASGRYIWWFSDDDEFVSDAVGRALKLVRENPKIDCIWMNFESDLGDKKVIAIDRPEGFFRDGSEVLDVVGTNIGLLSTYFLNREKGLQSLPLVRRYVRGFSFASTMIFVSVLSGAGKFYFSRGPNLVCHPTTIEEIKESQKRGAKNEGFQVYGIDFYRMITAFRGKFSRRSIRRILKKNFGSLWRGMLVAWIGGWDSPYGKRWQMFKLYWNFPEFWPAVTFFLLPVALNKFFYRIYKLFFSHRRFRYFH